MIDRYYDYSADDHIQRGVNIILNLNSGGGVYNMTFFLAAEFVRKNIPFCIVPLAGDTIDPAFSFLSSYMSRQCLYKTNILSAGIPFVKDLYNARPDFFHSRRNINLTTWELPVFPERLWKNIDFLDEIWCVSAFNAETLQKATSKPVRLVDFGLRLSSELGVFYGRDYFSLPKDRVLFLVNFEFTSSQARKNPEAAIEAFYQARKEMNNEAGLVLHMRCNPLHGQEWVNRLHEFRNNLKQSQDADIFFIEMDNMTYSQQIGLKRSCDCYVTLHRAEGYGLSCAEALDLGHDVIMTGFSGNLDVLHPTRWDSTKALTVSYREIPVKSNDFVWVDEGEEQFQYWADVNVEDAATRMVEVYYKIKTRRSSVT